MKLSMWILANLLESFDPEIQIREHSPRVLHSARMAHATNCVYVRQEGDGCLCSWNTDTIRLPELSALEGYELLQSLFDFMYDWQEQISKAAESQDFPLLVDLCFPLFHNPIVLCDASHKTLAMSSHYGAEDVDEEWYYLKTYGYPSMVSPRKLGDAEITYHMSGEIVQFQFSTPSGLHSCLSSHLLSDGIPVGFLTVVEKDRPMNYGDMQLLQVLSQLLIPSLSRLEHSTSSQGYLFQQLMEGKPLSPNRAQQILQQKSWDTNHFYRVILVDFEKGESPSALWDRYYHFAALDTKLPEDLFGYFEEHPVILANETLCPHTRQLEIINQLLDALPVRIACSLPCQGFSLIPELFRQAVFALDYFGSAQPECRFPDFQDCAIDYLIRSPYNPDTCLAACHPDARLLLQSDEILYRTLVVYLNQDRSVTKTIQYLYIHKNTLLHRLKKIEEILQHDLSDSYYREYMRFSFVLLERHAGLAHPPAPVMPDPRIE